MCPDDVLDLVCCVQYLETLDFTLQIPVVAACSPELARRKVSGGSLLQQKSAYVHLRFLLLFFTQCSFAAAATITTVTDYNKPELLFRELVILGCQTVVGF